tara:strand:+ start:1727 stop:1951 length:225 start_codon:yes stop_codon:yes gene_type:complete
MYEVNITMKDASNGKTVSRTIDGSNLMVHNGETSHIASCPEIQRTLLQQWINERANEQHGTMLELVSWFLVKAA